MLQSDREQTLGVDFDFFFIGIEGGDLHLRGALDLGGEVDHAQTPLLPNHLAFAAGDHRIDQLVGEFAGVLVVDVQNNDPLRRANLRRGEPNARSRVHGIEHVAHQLRGICVDVLDRRGDFAQHGRRELENFQNRHNEKFITYCRDRHQCGGARCAIWAQFGAPGGQNRATPSFVCL